MAASSSNDDGEISGINVTPLVDVMLVLLIIFMVTANLINNKSIAVELPKAATGEDTAAVRNLAFVVDKTGAVYMDGSPIEISELPNLINQSKARSESVQALIGADLAAPYGPVVKVIDTLRLNGVTDFALNIQSE